jgi:Ni,Fe-hydrogenase III component G
MEYFITHLKDSTGINNYLGIDIPHDNVEPYLNELKEHLSDLDFEQYTKNQQLRDKGHYHITVINVMDYNRLMKDIGMDEFINSLDTILKYEIDDLKMYGVGTAEQAGNRSFFVVCQSDKLDAIRTRFDLPKQDFHITIGFKDKDVHGVRKNEVLKKGLKFLQLLKSNFYKYNNWEFVKEIRNFDLDKRADLIPIEITETSIKLRCGGHYLVVGYLEDGQKFWILAKYPVDEDLPRLPETEIAKILNKK